MFAARVGRPLSAIPSRVPRRSYAVGDNLVKKAGSQTLRNTAGETVPVAQIFKGKKVVVLGTPGAFSTTCHVKHVPSFLDKYEQLKGKGVNEVIVVAVNDFFVMKAWGENLKAGSKVKFYSDFNAAFTEAIGMSVNLAGAGLGTRSKRYTLLVDDGVVKAENVEKSPSEFSVTSADEMLKALDSSAKK